MSPRRQHARQTGIGLPRHAPPRARASGRGRWWAVAATAALVLTGGNLAWASATEAQADEPPEIVTLTAEVGVTAEDGTVSLLAPAELDGAMVTEVLPSNGEEIDEDDVILVVEAPSGDTSQSSGAQEVGSQLRVSSPSSGTLEVRAEVGDELSTGDIVATTAPVAAATAAGPVAAVDTDTADAAAAPAELAAEGAPGAQGPVDEDEAVRAASVPESEDQVQPGDDTQSGLGQSGAEQSGAAQSGAEPRVAVSGRSASPRSPRWPRATPRSSSRSAQWRSRWASMVRSGATPPPRWARPSNCTPTPRSLLAPGIQSTSRGRHVRSARIRPVSA